MVFEATITQTDVREVGLETADGRLITRVVFDSAVDIDGTVSVTLDVSNDESVSRGVLTNDGQAAVRDVLADNTPALPNAYAYGDDGTAVAETDTTLGNELVETDLDEILIQSASTQAQWESIAQPQINEPIVVDGGEIRTTEISKVGNRQSWTSSESQSTLLTESNFEDGIAQGIRDVVDSDGNVITDPDNVDSGFPDRLVRTATFEYDVENVAFGLRLFNENGEDITNGAPFEIFIQGERIVGFGSGFSFPSGWELFGPLNEVNIEAGEPVEILLEIDTDRWDPDENYEYVVTDVHALYDDDFTFDFQETLDSPEGRLERPSTHPELVDIGLNTATTRRNVTEANFESTWNNTENEQYIELANDENTFTRFNNTTNGSVTFADAESSVDTNIGLSRFSDGEDRTPLLGNSGQAIDSWQLVANPDAVFSDNINATLTRAIIQPNTLAPGTTIREAGLKSDGVLLTRHELASFDVLEGQRISSSESTTFSGSN